MAEKAVAEKWRVSVKWIQKIKKRRQDTGSFEPVKGNPGRKARLAECRESQIRRMIKTTPGATPEYPCGPPPVQACIQTAADEAGL
ncbi:MAG: hypothetical protein LBD58_05430 [Treponema sp.]|jgi:transposase|nr:hypothetical protein [Treponema sp.]